MKTIFGRIGRIGRIVAACAALIWAEQELCPTNVMAQLGPVDTNSEFGALVDEHQNMAYPTDPTQDSLNLTNYSGGDDCFRVGYGPSMPAATIEFYTNYTLHSSFSVLTNGTQLAVMNDGTVAVTGTNGVFTLFETNGVRFAWTNGNLTISSNGLPWGALSLANINAEGSVTCATLNVTTATVSNFNGTLSTTNMPGLSNYVTNGTLTVCSNVLAALLKSPVTNIFYTNVFQNPPLITNGIAFIYTNTLPGTAVDLTNLNSTTDPLLIGCFPNGVGSGNNVADGVSYPTFIGSLSSTYDDVELAGQYQTNANQTSLTVGTYIYNAWSSCVIINEGNGSSFTAKSTANNQFIAYPAGGFMIDTNTMPSGYVVNVNGNANFSALAVNGIQWISEATNANPGPFMTNLPWGTLCTTTNGQLFVLSNAVWNLK